MELESFWIIRPNAFVSRAGIQTNKTSYYHLIVLLKLISKLALILLTFLIKVKGKFVLVFN
jgi:hypothetical protein